MTQNKLKSLKVAKSKNESLVKSSEGGGDDVLGECGSDDVGEDSDEGGGDEGCGEGSEEGGGYDGGGEGCSDDDDGDCGGEGRGSEDGGKVEWLILSCFKSIAFGLTDRQTTGNCRVAFVTERFMKFVLRPEIIVKEKQVNICHILIPLSQTLIWVGIFLVHPGDQTQMGIQRAI